MDIGSQIKSGVRWLAFGKAISQIYKWVFTILTMRILEPNVYGLLAIAAIFLSFVALFEELGLRTKLVQMKEFKTEYVRNLYGLSIVTNALLTFSLIAVAPVIAMFFDRSELTAVIIVLALQFLVSSLAVIPDAMIKRQLDFRKITIIDVAHAVTASTFTFVLAFHGFGVWSLVFATVVATCIKTSGLIIASPFRESPTFNFRELGSTLRFGGLITAQRLMFWVYSNLDRFLIGRLFDAHMLGLYSVSSILALMPLEKVGSTVNIVSFTGLSRAADEPNQFRRYLLRACRLIALVLFPAFLGIAAIAQEFVPIVLGAKWLGVETLIPIITLSIPARCLSLPLMEALNSLGKPLENLKCAAFTAVAFAVGIVLGVSWGLHGIATGIVIASSLAFAYTLHIVEKNTGVRPVHILKEVWKPLLASMVMCAFLLVLRSIVPLIFPSIEGLIFSICAGALCYLTTIALLDREGLFLVLELIRPKRMIDFEFPRVRVSAQPESDSFVSRKGFPPPVFQARGANASAENSDGDSSGILRRDPIGFSKTRLFERATTDGIEKPTLVVFIDVEEEFDWSKPFSRDNFGVKAIERLPKAHDMLVKRGIKPTYLIDYPVIASPTAAALFRSWSERGECIVGTQLHPWVNPPFEEDINVANSYAGHLPRALERTKLTALTEMIETNCGVRPVIYRAGRFGLGSNSIELLEELGYIVDASIIPYTDLRHQHGPDFSGYTPDPFWFGHSRRLLEIPLTRAFTGPMRRFGPGHYNSLDQGIGRVLRLSGIAARLGLLQRVTLTPEGITLDEMKRLTEEAITNGRKLFALSFHSPSLLPGSTPYVKTEGAATEFLEKIDNYLDFFFNRLGGEQATPIEIHRKLSSHVP